MSLMINPGRRDIVGAGRIPFLFHRKGWTHTIAGLRVYLDSLINALLPRSRFQVLH